MKITMEGFMVQFEILASLYLISNSRPANFAVGVEPGLMLKFATDTFDSPSPTVGWRSAGNAGSNPDLCIIRFLLLLYIFDLTESI